MKTLTKAQLMYLMERYPDDAQVVVSVGVHAASLLKDGHLEGSDTSNVCVFSVSPDSNVIRLEL